MWVAFYRVQCGTPGTETDHMVESFTRFSSKRELKEWLANQTGAVSVYQLVPVETQAVVETHRRVTGHELAD